MKNITKVNKPELSLPEQIEPTAVILQASKAAQALTDIIKKKAKPIMIGGEQYLEFEDWQTLGQFYYLSVKTHDAVPITINGIEGAKAQSDLIDVKTGFVIGGAESYCLRDEPNWRTKPFFQLASMAQTRSASKALRNKLAWVVVLAGYKPTPAEEMIAEQGQIQPPKTNYKITPFQMKKIFALVKDLGGEPDEGKEFIKKFYKVDSLKDLEINQASSYIKALEEKLVLKHQSKESVPIDEKVGALEKKMERRPMDENVDVEKANKEIEDQIDSWK